MRLFTVYAVRWVSSCANLTSAQKVLTLGLVKGEEDDRAVVVEVAVSEERVEPVREPVAGKVDRRVVRLNQTSASTLRPRTDRCSRRPQGWA